MKLIIDNLVFNLLLNEDRLNQNLRPILFLHGFTGSAFDWQFLSERILDKYLPISIDLIGHGQSSKPLDESFYSAESQINHLKKIIEYFKFTKVILCGYSMGGRLALSFAAKHPDLIDRIILESTSPGLNEQIEREERAKNDSQLADKIMKDGMDKFIDYWMSIPLFESLKQLPDGKFQEIVELKKNNNTDGLANSLRGFSTGRMPSLWDELQNLQQEVLLITGENDKKFSEINEEMIRLLNCAGHITVPGCGHNVHLEKPEEFIILVNQFLKR